MLASVHVLAADRPFSQSHLFTVSPRDNPLEPATTQSDTFSIAPFWFQRQNILI